MTVQTWAHGQTVTLISRVVTGRDRDNNDVYTDVPTVIDNVPVWQTSSVENAQGGDMVTSDLTALLPVGVDVSAVDKVQVVGLDFEVVANPWIPTSPFTGFQSGVVVELRRVTG